MPTQEFRSQVIFDALAGFTKLKPKRYKYFDDRDDPTCGCAVGALAYHRTNKTTEEEICRVENLNVDYFSGVRHGFDGASPVFDYLPDYMEGYKGGQLIWEKANNVV